MALGDVSNAVKSTSTMASGGKLVQQLPSKQNLPLASRKPSRTALSSQSASNGANNWPSHAESAARSDVPDIPDERHHVSTAEIANVYHRVRQSKQTVYSDAQDAELAGIEDAVSAVKVSSDSSLELQEQDEERADDTKELLYNNTTSILHNLDSTDYTNVQTLTNPGALFPVISDKTRREYEQIASAFCQSEEAKALEPDYEGDEDWYDVSMVAEYSDEIFMYMRELEVSCCPMQ